MNALSLAYSNAQKQQSWIDDPFDLKGLVTGVTPVSHQRSLEDYAMELVSNFAKYHDDHYELDLDMLPTSYKLELTRRYIESIEREIEWACYGEDQTINSEFLCAMLAMLKDSNPQTRMNFAQVTTRNLLEYYKEPLQDLINIACNELFCAEMHEAGFRGSRDVEHGDFVWSKCE